MSTATLSPAATTPLPNKGLEVAVEDACGCGHDHSHDHDHGHHGHSHAHSHSHSHAQAPFVRTAAKVGRNDACPCGSGKKHKKCCL
jgi:ABC-type Zn2+ transport system substrate-binding protein/surface adhesin